MPDYTRVGLKGVLERLNAVSAFTDLITSSGTTRLYTDIPQEVIYPYALVEISSNPFTTKDNSVHTHNIVVHGYSRTSSPNEALQISEQAFNALDRQESNITLDSGTLVYINQTDLKDIFKEPDSQTWHSVIEFNALIY